MECQRVVRRTFWTVIAFYILIAFEFFYMASPFAAYFYSVYGPGLKFFNQQPALAWLGGMFLPHLAVETRSPLLDFRNILAAILATTGFLGFCVGAGQVYYRKLTRKGAAEGGVYKFIRHPQYLSLMVCSFGLLLFWPRFMVLLSFIAVLFAYYFLARLEERECEEKFTDAYADYKNKTSMFLPFSIPFAHKLPRLPQQGVKRYLAILSIFVAALACAITLATGVKYWSLNQIYAIYSKDFACLSLTRLEDDDMGRILKLSLNDIGVKKLFANNKGAGTKFLNYIMPAKWDVSEIPMAPVENIECGLHFFQTGIGDGIYKIIFTKVDLRDPNAQGKEIVLNTVKRHPVAEAWVDINKNQVVAVKSPPADTRYGNIPLPIY